MFLRQTQRKKDGKTHTYWSVVENQRLQGGRVVQRHVLYLGEISPSQAAACRVLLLAGPEPRPGLIAALTRVLPDPRDPV